MVTSLAEPDVQTDDREIKKEDKKLSVDPEVYGRQIGYGRSDGYGRLIDCGKVGMR